MPVRKGELFLWFTLIKDTHASLGTWLNEGAFDESFVLGKLIN